MMGHGSVIRPVSPLRSIYNMHRTPSRSSPPLVPCRGQHTNPDRLRVTGTRGATQPAPQDSHSTLQTATPLMLMLGLEAIAHKSFGRATDSSGRPRALDSRSHFDDNLHVLHERNVRRPSPRREWPQIYVTMCVTNGVVGAAASWWGLGDDVSILTNGA
eukprot:7118305-Prymnesium_polylepis.3